MQLPTPPRLPKNTHLHLKDLYIFRKRKKEKGKRKKGTYGITTK